MHLGSDVTNTHMHAHTCVRTCIMHYALCAHKNRPRILKYKVFMQFQDRVLYYVHVCMHICDWIWENVNSSRAFLACEKNYVTQLLAHASAILVHK